MRDDTDRNAPDSDPVIAIEDRRRVTVTMVEAMSREGFGNCSRTCECEAACPKSIPVRSIARMNRAFLGAALTSREFARPPGPHDVHDA